MFINTRQPFLLSTILQYMRQRDKIRDKILAYRYCNETLIDNLRLVRCRWNLTRSGWVPHRPGVSISDFIRLARPIYGNLCKSRGSPRRSERAPPSVVCLERFRDCRSLQQQSSEPATFLIQAEKKKFCCFQGSPQKVRDAPQQHRGISLSRAQ